MFYLMGEYDHQMDSKNRIRIPNKLKGEEKGLYFSKGPNNCILCFYEEAFTELTARLEEKVKEGGEELRKTSRVFMKSFTYVEGDGQGRMILPQKLKEYAKIDRDVVICGAGSRIEIWAKEVHDEYYKDEDNNFGNMFNSLGIY